MIPKAMFFRQRLGQIITLLLILVSSVMVVGVMRLSFDDDYKNLFRSQSEDFETLETFLKDFPADENNLSIVFNADDILSHEVLIALQKIVSRIEDLPEVETVFSIYSIPSKTSSVRQMKSLIPDDLENVKDLNLIVEQVQTHPLIDGNLLSDDHRVTLVIAGLASDVDHLPEVKLLLSNILDIAHKSAGDTGLQINITGNPAIRLALKSQSIHDQIVFNLLGGSLAGIIAYLIYRSVLISLLVSTGPFLGVLWTLGCMGFANIQINVINQMIAPLIMVIGYTDAVHLMFSIQRQRREGIAPLAASLGAVREVGLACALTSATTGIGFGSLILSSTQVIQELAVFAALGTLLTFLCVICFVPMAASILPDSIMLGENRIEGGKLHSSLFCSLADTIQKIPTVSVVVGALLTILTLYSASFLNTDFRFRENLPRAHQVSNALEIADNSLGGVQTLNIELSWPQSLALDSPYLLRVIAETQDLLTKQSLTQNTLSIIDVLKTLPGSGDNLLERISRLVYLPKEMVGWFVNEPKRKALITARIPDSGARSQIPLLDKIERQLVILRVKYPEYKFSLTGITVSAARGSVEMITDMAFSLMGAAVVIFILLALVLKSVKLGIISFLPNILPLASVAAILVWNNQPLQYASIMVFTVCLGIIVDDTIHFLVRYKREYKKTDNVEEAVQQTLTAVAPVLVTTTLILLAGFGAMMTSATEVVVRMGMLSCLALIIALFSDLIVLPALIRVLYRKKTVLEKAQSKSQ